MPNWQCHFVSPTAKVAVCRDGSQTYLILDCQCGIVGWTMPEWPLALAAYT
jgi:hypothetical protein